MQTLFHYAVPRPKPESLVLTVFLFCSFELSFLINYASMTRNRNHPTPSPAACPERSRRASAAGKIKATHKVCSGLLFLTCATYKRIPLFRYRKPCRIFLENLIFYRKKYDLKINGYVLMPNHFHLLLWFPAHHKFADFLRELKGATAKQTLDWIKHRNYTKLLSHLRHTKQPKRRKDSRYSVWQRNSYVTSILNPRMARVRLNYLHSNPCREKLAKTPEEYPWSSAAVYAGKEHSTIQIDLLEF